MSNDKKVLFELPYGENCSYWKTSKSSVETWINRIYDEIKKVGGEIFHEGFGNDALIDRAAYMFTFQIGTDIFKIIWPVLPSKTGDVKAAKVQAITMIYHDIKARCITAQVLGSRTSFFSYLVLPDGKTAAESNTPELIPSMLAS